VSELINLDLKDLDIWAKRIRLLRKGGDMQTLPLSDGIILKAG
jgi:site-specific recombinase XerC